MVMQAYLTVLKMIALLVGSTCVRRLLGAKRGQGFKPDNHIHTLINT